MAPQGTQVPLSPAACWGWVRCFCFQVQSCGMTVEQLLWEQSCCHLHKYGAKPPKNTHLGMSLHPGGVWALLLSQCGQERDKPEQVSINKN